VRPAMMYGSECWPVNWMIELRMSIADMRMLRWRSRVIRQDEMRNEYIRDSIEVTSIVDKMREDRLKWLLHILRR